MRSRLGSQTVSRPHSWAAETDQHPSRRAPLGTPVKLRRPASPSVARKRRRWLRRRAALRCVVRANTAFPVPVAFFR
jgi:hypothetical protein